jgi:hypothetical protein
MIVNNNIISRIGITNEMIDDLSTELYNQLKNEESPKKEYMVLVGFTFLNIKMGSNDHCAIVIDFWRKISCIEYLQKLEISCL